MCVCVACGLGFPRYDDVQRYHEKRVGMQVSIPLLPWAYREIMAQDRAEASYSNCVARFVVDS